VCDIENLMIEEANDPSWVIVPQEKYIYMLQDSTANIKFTAK